MQKRENEQGAIFSRKAGSAAAATLGLVLLWAAPARSQENCGSGLGQIPMSPAAGWYPGSGKSVTVDSTTEFAIDNFNEVSVVTCWSQSAADLAEHVYEFTPPEDMALEIDFWGTDFANSARSAVVSACPAGNLYCMFNTAISPSYGCLVYEGGTKYSVIITGSYTTLGFGSIYTDYTMNITECQQCGDGALQPPEQCDEGGETAGCDADCTLAECGDGTVNTTAGETCDEGGETATCDSDCTAPACGDGVVNATVGEQCDGGGETADCDSDCTLALCGDGQVNATAGETCDQGGESETCDSDCTAPACGDGVVNATVGEQCDGGGETATCDSDCTAALCGDGVVNATAGETCDQGGETATCDSDCTAALCGDRRVNVTAGETCDVGGESASCNANCTLAECGDGVVNGKAGEVCDAGGESASCDTDCTPAVCGDLRVNATAGESCDDGNGSNNDDCLNTCVLAVCGDGFVREASEECDDENTEDDDGCDSTCSMEPGWECIDEPSLCELVGDGPDGGRAGALTTGGGCGCSLPGGRGGSNALALFCLGLLLAAAGRRRTVARF
jgi:cysteine-rich repeat protein